MYAIPVPPTTSLRIATINVNGIRAAYRKGMGDWLDQAGVDLLCLQEVRAPAETAAELLGDSWHLSQAICHQKGRAGVLIAMKAALGRPVREHVGLEEDERVTSGRWVELDCPLPHGGTLTVVSVYVHSGQVDTPRQDDKYRFLDAMLTRMRQLREHSDQVLVAGDYNIGHTERDIKNWKGNLKNAGFLPEERTYCDRIFGGSNIQGCLGYVDVHRTLVGDIDGPYTWWSQRGQAFDSDTGWRIDYQIASPAFAALAAKATVDRAASYDARWSDHAPLVIDYGIPSQ